MREIPLTQGKVALVDDADYEELSRYKWHACKGKHNRSYYAARNVPRANGSQATTYMHRVILDAPSGIEVDHRDTNGLNNQRDNLRLATVTQNQHNTSKRSNNTSGFKGVSHHRATGKFQADISVNGRNKYLGLYATPEQAHAAYCAAASALRGEFSRTA